MPLSKLFLYLPAVVLFSLVISADISPSASYFSPWDSAHTLTTSVDVEDQKFASFTKTGTTIVGLSCRDGVVLGADTRSTGGPLVMDKNKLKIHVIASRIFCCAAGTSADCDQITRRAGHDLALLRLERELCGEESSFDPIQAAIISVTNSLENTQGGRKPSSVMILGGIDNKGPALYIIDDNKVHQRVNFAALGSGSTDAIALLETAKEQWRLSSLSGKPEQLKVGDDIRFVEDVGIDAAVRAVRQAVHAGIMNDLGSGSHIDICVIHKSGVRQWRESLSTEWDQRKAEDNDSRSAQFSLSGDSAEGQDNSVAMTDNDDGSLGEMIFSRSKLLNFLQRNESDENIIKKTEVREKNFNGDASCHIQKI